MTRSILIGLVLLVVVGATLLGLALQKDPLSRRDMPIPTGSVRVSSENAAEFEGGGAVSRIAPTRDARQGVRTPPAAEDGQAISSGPLLVGNEHLDVIAVRDDGAPVTSLSFRLAALSAVQAETDPATEQLLQLRSTTGRYRLEGLSPGNWRILPVYQPGYFPDPARTLFEFQVPRVGPPPVFRLLRPGAITGRVIDALGEPVDASVIAITPEEQQIAKAEVVGSGDPDASFLFRTLPPGPLILRAESEWTLRVDVEVQVLPGLVSEGIVLRLPEGGWIDAVVFDRSGGTTRDAAVVLMTQERMLAGKQVDDDGHAFFGPLPPGPWSVLGLFDSDRGDGILPAHADVFAGQTTTVELRHPSGGITVHGLVTADELPFAGATLYFVREGEPLVESFSMVETDDQGRYELTIPHAGPVQVILDRNGPQPFVRALIPDTKSYELDLRLPTGRLDGRVVGPAEDPWNGRVLLEREDGGLDLLLLPDRKPGVEVSSEERAFHFENVPPGRYRLRLSVEEDIFAAPLLGIEVEEGRKVDGLELRVQEGGSLRVVVRGANGNLASKASVLVRDPTGLPLIDLPRTTQAGEVTVTGLPPGPALVSAQSEGGVAVREVRVELQETSSVRLVLEEGAFLTVHCTRQGHPLGASMRVFGPRGDEMSRLLPLQTYRSAYNSLLSGSTKEFGPLPPGHYSVRATAPDGSEARKSVSLSAGDRREVRLRL